MTVAFVEKEKQEWNYLKPSHSSRLHYSAGKKVTCELFMKIEVNIGRDTYAGIEEKMHKVYPSI